MASPVHLSHRRPAHVPALPMALLAAAVAQLAGAFLPQPVAVVVAIGLVVLAMVVVAVRRASRAVDTILAEELGRPVPETAPRRTSAPRKEGVRY
jgi:uncharacterized membrane protein YoaK (UPF0700 family)